MAAPDFFVEDLLDLSNADDIVPDTFLYDDSPSGDISVSTDSSITAANSSISPVGFDRLPVPYDDLGELEWLSNFEEEFFPPSDDVDLHLIIGPDPDPTTIPRPEIPVPATPYEPANVHSRKRALSPNSNPITIPWVTPCEPGNESRKRALSPKPDPIAFPRPEIPVPVTPCEPANVPSRKRAPSPKPDPKVVRQRRCSHCSIEKTPQWRTGPMGPQTLCNACGVRYKSGRLVPEYRPAASPTFVPNRHSNSHKRVMELRKQKAGQRSLLRHQQFRRPGPVVPAAGGFFLGDVNRRVSPI